MVGLRVSEPAIKPNKARRRQSPNTRQPFWPPLKEHHLLAPAWPDRLDEAPASAQLTDQRGWYLRKRCRDQHRVIRRAGRVSPGAIASYDQDVADALGAEVVAGLGGDIGPALDADYGGR